MAAWQVLIGNLPVKEGVDPCPFGLLVPAEYGQGATIHRCHLMAGHKAQHQQVCTYPGCGKLKVRVVTSWETVENWFPVVGDPGKVVA